MKWKSFLLFFQIVTTYSFSISGKWKPNNLSLEDVVVHIIDKNIIGMMNDRQTIEMNIIDHDQNKIVLSNLKVKQKPPDWFNIVKYKDYIKIFQEIRQYGIVCDICFLDENSLEIKSQIGEQYFQFVLSRIQQK